jgi:hypothetical protein
MPKKSVKRRRKAARKKDEGAVDEGRGNPVVDILETVRGVAEAGLAAYEAIMPHLEKRRRK